MPFLRQEGDVGLGDTLGNLGAQLTQAFNPMNQIRAYDALAQMRQRQWEVQHAQALDAANQNAANVYDIANPLDLDPASKAVEVAKIRSGNPTLTSQIVEGLKAAGTLKAAQTAAGLIAARHPDWDQAHLASAQSDVLSGRKDLNEIETEDANTKLATLKTGTTQTATTLAQNPNTSPADLTRALTAEATASGQPDTGAKLAAGGRLRDTTGQLTPQQIDQANADRAIMGLGPLPIGTSPTVTMQPSYDASRAAADAQAAAEKKQAEDAAGGVTPAGQYFPKGPPGSPGNQAPATVPVPGAPVQPPAPPPPVQPLAVADPNNPANTPQPIITPLPNGGATLGETDAQRTQRLEADKTYTAQLQGAIDEGVAGQKMLGILDRLKTLAQLAGTQGSSQIPTWVDTWLRDHHLVMTNRQGILAEMQAEFNAQIPELRKDMGVKFEAGPELSAQAKMIGDPSLPTNVLMGIFARQAAIAQMSVQRRELAMRALYPHQANPLSKADYLAQEAQIYDNVTNEMRQQVKDFGGITPQSVAPPPAPGPSGGGGGGNATEVWDVDASGKPYRVR